MSSLNNLEHFTLTNRRETSVILNATRRTLTSLRRQLRQLRKISTASRSDGDVAVVAQIDQETAKLRDELQHSKRQATVQHQWLQTISDIERLLQHAVCRGDVRTAAELLIDCRDAWKKLSAAVRSCEENA